MGPRQRGGGVVAEQPLDPAFPLLKQASAVIGARAWAVGGYVRDVLLRREHPDLDVVVEEGRGIALAEEFARSSGSREPVIFERFGTAQVTWQGRLLEFVSTRSESYDPDSRKPSVRPATLEEDLRRRDFTVNTLLMDFDGNVEDRLGTALRDLQAGVLRTPLDPEETFRDDPLRMLRAVRFAAQLGFELDPSLLPAMRRLRSRVQPPVLSVERAADELRKMLLSPRPALALELLDAGALLDALLPEVGACKGVAQGGWHTHDVFGHTLLTVAATPPELTVRLAALLHDIGKPPTARPDGSFLGHETVGADLTRAALHRLRFSNAEVESVAKLVRLHLRPVYYSPEWTDGAVRRLAASAGDDVWSLLDLARADVAASAYPDAAKLDELARRIREVLQERPSRLEIPVTGEDIMRERELAPGPEVGRLKQRLLDLVMEGALEPDRQAILDHLRSHPEL